MKKQPRKLRTNQLNVEELRKVHGGRGTACGDMLHCSSCGAMYPVGEAQCPYCGAATDDSGGGGGCLGDGIDNKC